MHKLLSSFLTLVLLASFAPEARTEESVKDEAKDLGRAVKRDAKTVGGKIKKGARKAKGAAKSVGQDLKAAAKKAKRKLID